MRADPRQSGRAQSPLLHHKWSKYQAILGA